MLATLQTSLRRVHWRRLPRIHWLTLALLLLAVLIGMALPLYVGLMGDKLGKLAVFPALLVLAILLANDRRQMFVMVIILRAAGDILFDSTRFGVGAVNIGLGGVINAFLILLVLLMVMERPALLPKRQSVPWLLFLLVFFFGIFVSLQKADAVRYWLGQLSNFAMFVGAFYLVRSKQDFAYCVRLVVWSSLLPALFSFVDIALHHGGGGGSDADGFRLRSTFGHPNILAFYLTLVIALSFYLIKSMTARADAGKRLVLGLYMLFLLALLVLTKTRSAWLACFVMFALYALIFERRYFIYMAVLGVVALCLPGVQERLLDLNQHTQLSGAYSKLNSYAWRIYLWESALHYMHAKDWLIGRGLQNFKEESAVFFPLASGHAHYNAHSAFVQLLYETGLFGFLSFLYLYYRVMRDMWRVVAVDRLAAFFIILIIVNFLIGAYSDNVLDYLSFNWYLWLIAGAGSAYARVVVGDGLAEGSVARRPAFGHGADRVVA